MKLDRKKMFVCRGTKKSPWFQVGTYGDHNPLLEKRRIKNRSCQLSKFTLFAVIVLEAKLSKFTLFAVIVLEAAAGVV